MKTLSLLLLLSLPGIAFSQAIRPYKLVDIGTGISLNRVAGDAETYTNTKSYNINISYNPDPYLNFVGEFGFGKLAGGNVYSLSGRFFQNDYRSVAFMTQIQLGYLNRGRRHPSSLPLQDLYAGLGLGVIANNIKNINRNSIQAPGYATPGLDNSVEIYFPLRLGYELKIKNSVKETLCKLDFGYQYNFGLGDNIDGFQAGKFKDNFAQIFVGLKICAFGRTWMNAY